MNGLLKCAAVAALVGSSTASAESYTDVEYITTSSAAKNWVLLDYVPVEDTIIEMTVEVPSGYLNKAKTLFCSRGGASDTTAEENTFTCFMLQANEFRFDYSKKGTGAAQGGTVAADTRYVITCNPAVGLTVNGGRIGSTSVISGFEAGNKLTLFASYTGKTTIDPAANDNYADFRVYGVRIWEGSQTDENLKFDLIPCLNDNGVPALRDAANGDRIYELSSLVQSSWKFSSAGSSSTNPAPWAVEGNWTAGVPLSAGDTATFNTNSTVTRYVLLPDDLTLAKINGESGSASVYYIGDKITFRKGPTSGIGCRVTSGSCLFADLIFPEDNFGYAYGTFCGRLVCPKGLVGSAGWPTWRMDWGLSDGRGVEKIVLEPINGYYMGSTALGNIYPPRRVAARTTDGWVLHKGSKFAYKSGAAAQSTYAPGQPVDCEGLLPSGTYVKYLISNTVIMLSAAALEESANATLVFGAHSPRVTQRFTGTCSAMNAYTTTIQAPNEGDELFRLEIATLGNNWSFRGSDVDTTYPAARSGTIALSNVTATTEIVFDRAHIEFTGRASGTPGITTASRVRLAKSGKDAGVRFTIPAGVAARVEKLTNTVTTLAKDGPGTLTTTSIGWNGGIKAFAGDWTFDKSDSQDTFTATTLVVSNGVTFTVGAGVTLDVSAGTLHAGGTIIVAEGAVLRPGKGFTCEKGSTICGKGRVETTWAAALNNVTFEDDIPVACVGVAGGGTWTKPTGAVVGTPALWMDASKKAGFTFADEAARTVSKWSDCRKQSADDGYLFATNLASAYPVAVTNAAGAWRYLQIDQVWTYQHNETKGLVWSRPLTGIRAVFAVMNMGLGGGHLLGRSRRFPYQDTTDFKTRLGQHGGAFYRRQNGTQWYGALTSDNAATTVQKGAWYLNGVRVNDPLVDTYDDNGTAVVEAHPIAPGATADAFGIFYDNGNNGGNGYNGCNRYHEVLVYTNELTFAERQQVAQYLSTKWLGRDIAYGTVADEAVCATDLSGATLEVTAGRAVKVELEGDGAVVKTGEGELDLGNPDAAEASVTIASGTAHVKSLTVSRDGVRGDAWVHIDMADATTYTKTLKNGTNYITKVLDCRGHDTSIVSPNGAGANCLYLTDGDLNGYPVLDFGLLKRGMASWGTGREARFRYTNSNSDQNVKAATVFAVMGNQGGGGQLLSGVDNSYPGRGWYRNLNGLTSGWATSPLLNGASCFITSGSDGGRAAQKGKMFRKNCEPYNPYTAMDEDYQLISYVSGTHAATAQGMGAAGYRNAVGGMRVAEFLIATNAWSAGERDYAEAYLMKKWFNVEKKGYRPATLGAVTLAAGTTLTVDGNAPLTLSTLAGAGTISGSVVLTESAAIKVPVESDGTIATLTVSGSVDVSKGGTVQLTGEVEKLKAGKYRLLAFTPDETGTWVLTGYEGRKILKLRFESDGLWLEVKDCGLMLLVK